MAEIKEGYASKPTRIKVYARKDKDFGRKAEIWLDQEGVQYWLLGKTLKQAKTGKKYKDFEVVQDEKGNRLVQGEQITEVNGHETLAYATLDELLELRDEINGVIQELVK